VFNQWDAKSVTNAPNELNLEQNQQKKNDEPFVKEKHKSETPKASMIKSRKYKDVKTGTVRQRTRSRHHIGPDEDLNIKPR
jgi:hypothetical protein